MGLYTWLVKVSWLGKLVSVFWWVELDFFSLECNEVSNNELGDAYGFGLTLGSLFLGAQGCVLVLLCRGPAPADPGYSKERRRR